MFLPILACIFACGQQASVAIEAAANAKAESHFVMIAGDPNVTPTNPDYIVISKAVARALAAEGFEQAKTPDQADLVVVVDWMVADPKIVLRHAGGDIGEPQVRGAAPGGKNGLPLGGSNNAASFGFGLEAQDRQQYVYDHTLTLKGVDRAAYEADPAAKALWTMTLTSEGDTDQASSFAPLMVAAAMPYMAVNAGKVHARVAEAEASARYVKGEIPAPPDRKP